MREVSGCDFCGETASGTFNVLPPEYDPEGKGKRMVLCDHCRDALASILDPLLDAKSEAGAGDVEPSVDDVAGGEPAEAGGSDDSEASEADGSAATSSEEPGVEGTTPTEEQRAEARMAKTGAGSSSRVPKGYRKTLRFLENREMPIDHDDAVEMIAGAYGLEESAVEAAIEHAAKHGRLKLLSGELHRA